MDMFVTAARLVKEWGGDVDQVLQTSVSIETALSGIQDGEQLREQARKLLISALVFRDAQTGGAHSRLMRQAREHIERAYADADLSLNMVASGVNLSPSHFSVVFGQETGKSFKDYLTGVRIQKARELLLGTALKSTDIAYRVGYNDPHYFSSVFKKNTGLSPTEFRLQVRAK
jgi:two-component system response regulator YesN